MTGRVVCDLRAVQSPDHRGRGIGRWSAELAAALERTSPDLVGAYLLDPDWSPPGAIDELLVTGKLAYVGTPEAAAATERASVYLSCSVFEPQRTIAHVRPPFVDRLGLRYAAVVHDLIPLRMADRYLVRPIERLWYRARLEVLRAADAVLANSSPSAADVVELLGVEPARCHVVGTGVSRRFAPPPSREGALAEVRQAMPELRGEFVLYPGGSDGRKNIEGLIDAFARMPGRVRARVQLVVVGDLPPSVANHYRHLARRGGIEDRLVLTGFVADDRLAQLYRATALLVFPSLAEGFGIPVAEALASGAAVAVSDRPPLDSLVPEPRARFDPEDPADMAATMSRCLSDASIGRAVRRVASVATWDEVATCAAGVLEALAGCPRRRWPRRRRIAVVSPFPPARTGVAGYSESLVAAMRRAAARRGDGSQAQDGPVQIDCFADGRNRYPLPLEPVGGATPYDARAFERVDGAVGGYEHVVYVLGNSECHAGALAALRRRPGTVLSHDVRVSGLLTFSSETPGAVPGGLGQAIRRSYPDLPDELGGRRAVSAADADRYGLLLLRDVLRSTRRLLVTSESARRLAVLDAGPELAERIAVLPFAVSRLTADERAAVGQARAAKDRSGPGRLRISSFGIVDPHKRPDLLLAALAELVAGGTDAELRLVGGISERLAEQLAAQAAALHVTARLHVLGDVAWPEYLRELGEADAAVQLRHRTSGEASGTVSECLSAGVPTVVSRIGWMAEIPDEAAVKVPHECSAAELTARLRTLLGTRDRRLALGAAGLEWADARTFDVAADALLDELGV